MKYSLKNLNKGIDRWINSKTNLAPDKEYTETFLRERYTDLVNNFDGFKIFIKNQHFQTTYHKYKIGDYAGLEKIFSNDDELISSYKYKIIDGVIKNELFKKIKEAITILEIKRKLDGLNQPSENRIEKDNNEIIPLIKNLLPKPLSIKTHGMKTIKINILQAIDELQNQIDVAYGRVEIIKNAQNKELIEQRLNALVSEIKHFDSVISSIDLKTALRRHFIEIDKEKHNAYLNEVVLKMDDLNKKLSTKLYNSPFKLIQVVNLKIVTVINELKQSQQNKQGDKITLHYALFHYYKQEGKHEPIFEKNNTTTKRGSMKEQAKKYGVGEDAFANCYYSISTGKDRNRISKTNIPHIEKVIEMLSDYPAGKKIAREELKKAELLP